MTAEGAPFYQGPVRWLTGLADGELDGFALVSWPELVGGWIARTRSMGMRRPSLESAAQPWLDWLGEVDRLAVVGVDLDGPAAAADLLGFVVEPATRRGVELVVEARQAIENLDEGAFVEPEFGYPHSLERLRWALRGAQPIRQAPARLPDTGFDPDPTQAAAVNADDGVVQVIAPAGSGKTTVLVERARELRRRGVPAETIACLTFNRAAKEELADRLQGAGVGDIDTFTFHGLAYRILADAGVLPKDLKIGEPTPAQWRRLASIAKAKAGTGVWIEPAGAAEKLSQIKLGLLLTSERYAAAVAESDDPQKRTMAALYNAHEEMQRERGRMDFDDLVLKAVLLLRDDEGVRERWQAGYHQVLVDEYQDIEPAQELIVRIVAAPHDQLFCVGDEDQMLYAFRRASIERIIGLDDLYPGLQRVAFDTNYRCPAKLVEASRALIAVNRVRFPKQIEPDPNRTDRGAINLRPLIRQADAAADIAVLLKAKQPAEVAVLARTTNALRPVALACADLGVPIDGSDRLFEPTGAQLALQQHLRLSSCEDAADAISTLRGPGGLDAWFEETDDLGGLDQFECEVLERAEEDAAGRTPAEFLADLEHQAEALRAIRKNHAIELLTIHGAKGRQWPHVILVACDEGTLPHVRSARVEPSQEARGEGIEAERRLGYVAFTRAQQRLDLHYDRQRPSPFLREAGVMPRSTRPPRVPPALLHPHSTPSLRRKLAALLRRRA
jgi:DNA helicase-2/ATP-dependent DNA helicase PcrA